MAKVSIIITHWAQNEGRSEIMRVSFESLFRSLAPDSAEVIVIDNGGSLEDSKWLLEHANVGNIACYIRNRKNLHFWYARNQGLRLAQGDYLVIADNDIAYHPGWLEECLEWLQGHPGKYLVTPIAADWINRVRPVRWCGELDGWKLNFRAGSNVFMMTRAQFQEIGFFDQHRIAGSKYTDRYVRMGYKMALMPTPKAFDLGFRNGYNLNTELENFNL